MEIGSSLLQRLEARRKARQCQGMGSRWVGTSRGGALGSGWEGSSRGHAEAGGVTASPVLGLHESYPSLPGPWRLCLSHWGQRRQPLTRCFASGTRVNSYKHQIGEQWRKSVGQRTGELTAQCQRARTPRAERQGPKAGLADSGEVQGPLMGYPGLVVQDLEVSPLCLGSPSSGGLGRVPVAMVIQLASQLTGPKAGIGRWSWWNPENRTVVSAELP